jgi:glutathione synthase/RimK-type ligase-like ATP-grasp enzyme
MNKISVGIQNTYPSQPHSISDAYRKILTYNKIEYTDLNCSSPDFWGNIEKIDYFIYRWAHTDYHQQIAMSILPVIEKFYGVPCFPNLATCWHYDDKIRQYYLLKSKGFPFCDSFVFYEKNIALEWAESDQIKLPIVFKLKSGSGATQVKLLKSRKEVIHHIKKIFNHGFTTDYFGAFYLLKTFNYNLQKTLKYWAKYFRNRLNKNVINPFWCKQKNYVLFQKYLPDNQYDTRVQITGDRAYAFVRYNRKNDFRASGSNNWSIDHKLIDMEFIKIAFRISEFFGFQSMAYDFMYDENKNPSIGEISYCFGDYPEFSTGYWDKELNWHPGRFLPQYFELVDLLKMPELKFPDIYPSSSYRKVKV